MIYGRNFNRTNHNEVNDALPKRFAERIKLRENGTFYAVGADKGCDLILSGICNTIEEVDAMRSQADNGKRRIRIAGPRQFGSQPVSWFAIYCG